MDADKFDAFYTASFGRLVGQVYAMCGNFTEAQDCVQEAFVRAWDHRKQLEAAHAPEAWVRTVAWRLAVSRWRRTRRSLLPPDRAHLPAPPREPGIAHTALVAALKQLPEEQRRAIVLHHLCDLSVDEVARETEAPSGTVKARLSRGRAALAGLLTDDQNEEARHA
ncbi:MAG: SigE family RNA polymerase sigma factor [Propionibacteriales bacterium]|nr:SigE family RNA polymerase sigma factor [Propionibacteriales bacterium]